MIISLQFGQLNFVAFVPVSMVRLQLVQMGACIVVVVLVAVLMVRFSFVNLDLYNEGLLIFAVFKMHLEGK